MVGVVQQPTDEFLSGKALFVLSRIGNLTGRNGILAFARDERDEIWGYVNGKPARGPFWFSGSVSDPCSVVTVNFGGKGEDKEGGDAVKSSSVTLPFPLSGSQDCEAFRLRGQKRNGRCRQAFTRIAEAASPRKRWVTRSESVGWRVGDLRIL